MVAAMFTIPMDPEVAEELAGMPPAAFLLCLPFAVLAACLRRP